MARRRRLPDLPALVPGLRRRRGRRPRRDRVAPRPPRVARRRRGLALAGLSLADGRLGLRRRDHTAVDPGLRHARRLRRAGGGLPRARHPGAARPGASHTSIEHPWFREHPDCYVWADGDGPPNNWRSAFGGPAWSRDERSGRWYLHSFYPEQPDLDWRNPAVREAIGDVVRFWRRARRRRLSRRRRPAADEGPRAARRPARERRLPLPLHPELAALEGVHSRNDPEITIALDALREAAGDALLVGEVYVPSDSLATYLERLDLAFAFELLHSPWRMPRSGARRRRRRECRRNRLGAVEPRLSTARHATRRGRRASRGAAAADPAGHGVRLPGRRDRDGRRPRRRPAGRSRRARPASPPDALAGIARRAASRSGEPWLPLTDPDRRNVAAQRGDPDSILTLYRDLIALRRELGAGVRAGRRGAGRARLPPRRSRRRDQPRRRSRSSRRPRPELVLATDADRRPAGRLPPAPAGSLVEVTFEVWLARALALPSAVNADERGER